MTIKMVDLDFFDFSSSVELQDSLRRGSLSAGLATVRFEEALKQKCGVKHCVALNSGTAALHASLVGLNLPSGSFVAVPNFTFVSSVSMIVESGLSPILVGVDENGLMDLEYLESACEQVDIVAALPVYLYGNPIDLTALRALGAKYNFKIIADAAQAISARPNEGALGEIVEASTISFYGSKNIPSGEGGAVLTNSNQMADFARLFRNHGRISHYDYSQIGFNYRMSDMHSSLGLHALKKWDEVHLLRHQNYGLYADRLTQEGISFIRHGDFGTSSHHQFCIKVKHRDAIQQSLAEQAIETAIVYPLPVNKTSVFSKLPYFGCRESDLDLANSVLSLPVGPHIEPGDVSYICDALTFSISSLS